MSEKSSKFAAQMRKALNIGLLVIAFAVMLASMTGCANRGVGPQGGPKDTIPPMPLMSDPEQGSVDFHGKRIEVTFNEYIQLDNVATNLMMSPPQLTPPDVKARGKKLVIQFQDSLRDSTTYTLDFGNAVCDYHERVPLKGYSFYFATGPEIDTLETRGRVYDAETLNPVEGITVGIHSNMNDSAFILEPFLRIAKTDAQGLFRIGNIHPGRYRVYGIDDMSRDYRLTFGEALAFSDSVIRIQPGPDSIQPFTTLFLFKDQKQKLYMQRAQREKQHLITVSFSAPPDSLPVFRSLIDTLAWHAHVSANGDTAQIWLTDSSSISIDSLYFEARYRRTDSLNRLEWCTDTIFAIWRAPKLNAKAKEAQDRQNRNRRLEIKTNARKDFEIYDTLRLSFSTPIASLEMDSIHLYERVDTLLQPVPFSIAPHDTLPMELTIMAELKPGAQYEVQLDSGALHDVYGITHIEASYPLKVKTVEDYSTLRVLLKPFEPLARIQLLNSKDMVLREMPATEEGAFFEHLKPDGYYMRLYLDRNGDEQWTTGSWEEHRQPEPIFYFPEKIQTKSNWDFEQEWDYRMKPQTESKPSELVKTGGKKK